MHPSIFVWKTLTHIICNLGTPARSWMTVMGWTASHWYWNVCTRQSSWNVWILNSYIRRSCGFSTHTSNGFGRKISCYFFSHASSIYSDHVFNADVSSWASLKNLQGTNLYSPGKQNQLTNHPQKLKRWSRKQRRRRRRRQVGLEKSDKGVFASAFLSQRYLLCCCLNGTTGKGDYVASIHTFPAELLSFCKLDIHFCVNQPPIRCCLNLETAKFCWLSPFTTMFRIILFL